MNKSNLIIGSSCLLVTVSLILLKEGGNALNSIGTKIVDLTSGMLLVLPFIFIIIGLFEAWVDNKTVEKYFGQASGFRGQILSLLLGSTTVGPLVVAFPIAHSLSKKGASPVAIFTYLGAAATLRIPMTIFEASYMGIGFSIIRITSATLLILVSSRILGIYCNKISYTLPDTTG